jgi:hypothetical protein
MAKGFTVRRFCMMLESVEKSILSISILISPI